MVLTCIFVCRSSFNYLSLTYNRPQEIPQENSYDRPNNKAYHIVLNWHNKTVIRCTPYGSFEYDLHGTNEVGLHISETSITDLKIDPQTRQVLRMYV